MAESDSPTVPPSPVGTVTMPTAGPFTATLIARTTIAPGIVDLLFAMRSPPPLVFRAGQFVSMTVGTPAPEQGVIAPPRRSYSIASPPRDAEHLRLIVRVIPGGIASAYLMGLALHADVPMTGPHGFFVLDRQHPGDIVFGATGTGVSAVMPMLDELADQPTTGTRILYWGVRHEDDLFARAEIEALCRRANCQMRPFLSVPSPGWSGGRGRITAAVLTDLPTFGMPTFYLVGNGAMIAELKRELVAAGINRKKQIRTEAFFD